MNDWRCVLVSMIDFLLNQECVIYPWIREANGKDIYGEPETRRCRIHHRDNLGEMTGSVNGVLDQINARAKMFTTGSVISTRSKVECEGEIYIVQNCYTARGFAVNHLEVMLE